MRNEWTKEELKILRESHNKPAPFIKGRSAQSVRLKMMKLGLKNKPKRPSWSKEEIDIISNFSGDVPNLPGRTKRAVLAKISSLNNFPKKRKSSLWAEDEIDKLKSYEGNSIPFIEGRTKEAVKSKMKNLGLILSKPKEWSNEELSRLKFLFEKTNTSIGITIAGRSQKSIKRKIRELGLNKSKKGKNWSTKEISDLLNNKVIIGRSQRSIIRKKKELGLIKKKDYRQKWEKKELDLLVDLRKKGLSAAQIFVSGFLPHHTQTSIQKKLCRMGMVNKITKKIIKFPSDIKLKFNNFLLDNWKGKIPEELAEIWSKENSLYPVNSKRVARQLQVLNIKISSYEVIKIKTLRRKEKEIIAKSKGKESIHAINEKIRIERVKLMVSRMEKNIDIWTGLPMTEEEIKESLLA